MGAQFILPGSSAYGTAKHAINRLCEFVVTDHGDQGVKCFAIHPGAVKTELSTSALPVQFHSTLVDEPALPAAFAVWLSSGKADWATGRFLSANWDVDEIGSMRERILQQDLLVNRLRAERSL